MPHGRMGPWRFTCICCPQLPYHPCQTGRSTKLFAALLFSMGVGKSCVLPIQVPNPSPTLDKNLASLGRGILSSVGVGVWGKAPEAFPDSNTTLDTCQSATRGHIPTSTGGISGEWSAHCRNLRTKNTHQTPVLQL